MQMLEKEQFTEIVNNINEMVSCDFVKSLTLDIHKPVFGEVWICYIPVLVKDRGGVFFENILRPVLIIDDGHEYFVKNDNKNYYGLKITSQNDSYRRMKIINYKSLGLQKESFVRIEIPLKIEKDQFLYRIGAFSKKETFKYLKTLQKTLKI